MPTITRAVLEGFEGRHISGICTEVKFVGDEHNHCAHFVNHVLGFGFTLSCGGLMGRQGSAANIRVHETFAQCPAVGSFDARPPNTPCFAFVTLKTAVDVKRKAMTNLPKKHIGIFCDGEIWHYSNAKRKVVRETPEVFAKHFSGSGFALFFGTFPAAAPTTLEAPLTAAAKPPTLRKGKRDNADVATWQQFLILRGLLFGAPLRSMLDGDFGPMTEEATEAFQISAGLTPSGAVDEATTEAAVALGFIPRTSAPKRTALTKVTRPIADAAMELLERVGSTSVFYTEQLLTVGGEHFVARLEPHKHTTGARLRYWHRGVTLYRA